MWRKHQLPNCSKLSNPPQVFLAINGLATMPIPVKFNGYILTCDQVRFRPAKTKKRWKPQKLCRLHVEINSKIILPKTRPPPVLMPSPIQGIQPPTFSATTTAFSLSSSSKPATWRKNFGSCWKPPGTCKRHPLQMGHLCGELYWIIYTFNIHTIYIYIELLYYLYLFIFIYVYFTVYIYMYAYDDDVDLLSAPVYIPYAPW